MFTKNFEIFFKEIHILAFIICVFEFEYVSENYIFRFILFHEGILTKNQSYSNSEEQTVNSFACLFTPLRILPYFRSIFYFCFYKKIIFRKKNT